MSSTNAHSADTSAATGEPRAIADVAELEERLSRPDDDFVADLARLDGDILVLGTGGKMGPTLARMAKRAAPQKTVYAIDWVADWVLRDMPSLARPTQFEDRDGTY